MIIIFRGSDEEERRRRIGAGKKKREREREISCNNNILPIWGGRCGCMHQLIMPREKKWDETKERELPYFF